MKIKPLEKPKNQTKIKKRAVKNADRAFQNWGRAVYKFCLICGKPISCLHHFFPKSMSTALRYEIKNGIPICQGCHFSHHNGDPRIQETIINKKGKEWREDLEYLKLNLKVEPTLEWYKEKEKEFIFKAKYLIKK